VRLTLGERKVSINLTLFPTEAPAVIWLEDGSSVTADPQQEKQFQLPSGSFCTISSTAGSEEGAEHMSPEERALAFAEKMLVTWQTLLTKARAEMRKPTATPV
jgi:hypothetical protein